MKKILVFFDAVFLLLFATTVTAQTVCSNPKCHGGKVYCDDCDYTGKVGKETCQKCKGKGYYICPNCNGTGKAGSTGSVGNANNNSNSNTGNANNNVNVGSSSSRHEYKCPGCEGRGEVPRPCSNPKCHNGAIRCANCNATGNVSYTCAACNGSGVVTKERDKTCPVCQGQKYSGEGEKQIPCTHCRNGKVPSKNRRGETVWVDHADCQGKGYTVSKYKIACRNCGGTGLKGKESYTVDCYSCGGSGHIKETCKQCDGKGCYVCPTCKGYGNVREKCSRCKGTGVIYTD